MNGFKCPVCELGIVTLIPSTLEEEIPKNRCDRCGAVITFTIEEESKEPDESTKSWLMESIM